MLEFIVVDGNQWDQIQVCENGKWEHLNCTYIAFLLEC